MPGFNATGPFGRGPRTGRGLGSCSSGYRQAGGYGWFGRGVGRGGIPWGGGRGRAWGGGRGRGWRTYGGWNPPYFGTIDPPHRDWYHENVPYSAEEERNYLEDQLSMLQNEMDAIKSRMDELVSMDKEEDKGKK